MPTNSVTIDVRGELALKEQLAVIALPAAKRKRFNKQLGREVVKNTRQRLRSQEDVSGRKLDPRKDRSKRKMLRKIMKGTVVFSDDKNATVTWRNSLTGQIAKRHQEGLSEYMTATKMEKIHGQPDYGAPATRKQAVALREVGYRFKGKGKRMKKPSLKWMQENLTIGQAGIILRLMRRKKKQREWEIKLPQRAFLGMEPQQITQTSKELLQKLQSN